MGKDEERGIPPLVSMPKPDNSHAKNLSFPHDRQGVLLQPAKIWAHLTCIIPARRGFRILRPCLGVIKLHRWLSSGRWSSAFLSGKKLVRYPPGAVVTSLFWKEKIDCCGSGDGVQGGASCDVLMGNFQGKPKGPWETKALVPGESSIIKISTWVVSGVAGPVRSRTEKTPQEDPRTCQYDAVSVGP